MTIKTAPTKSLSFDGTSFAYRELGVAGGTPLVLLNHLTGVLDDWDGLVVDGLAAKHHVFVFDNRGVGGSEGTTPSTVEEMAKDAVGFIRALGLEQVDLLGFSLGGFVAQVIARTDPDLVRKLIIAGSGPAGGKGISNMGSVVQESLAKAAEAGKHPKHFLFFTQTSDGQAAADSFLARLTERQDDRDAPISDQTVTAQLTAITAWGQGDASWLSAIQHPVLVVNGDDDIMAPTVNSFELAGRLPNAQLSIFPDAGHGGIFQYSEAFVKQAINFLR